jgi:hypothetical protein
VGTQEFADQVIANLGKLPQHFAQVTYNEVCSVEPVKYKRTHIHYERLLVGYDCLIYEPYLSAEQLAVKLQTLQ